jgi:hypothetical protein
MGGGAPHAVPERDRERKVFISVVNANRACDVFAVSVAHAIAEAEQRQAMGPRSLHVREDTPVVEPSRLPYQLAGLR